LTWARLEALFETMGYPYSRQGSYAEGDTLPASFFTFWNFDAPEGGFYDNEANKVIWKWQVYFYTKDPGLMYSVMDTLAQEAKNEGFVVDGRAFDLGADEPGYVGRTIRLLYVETL